MKTACELKIETQGGSAGGQQSKYESSTEVQDCDVGKHLVVLFRKSKLLVAPCRSYSVDSPQAPDANKRDVTPPQEAQHAKKERFCTTSCTEK